jgi:hypothetical protein
MQIKYLAASGVNSDLKLGALLSKEKPTVKDYQDMLRWNLGDDYSRRTKGLKVAQLKELWETVKDSTILDISLPDEPVEPAVPGPNNTQMGQTIKQKFDLAIAAGSILNDDEFREIAVKFKAAAALKGINLEEVRGFFPFAASSSNSCTNRITTYFSLTKSIIVLYNNKYYYY